MAEPESPFLRPSPWGKMPEQAPMRIGPLPKAAPASRQTLVPPPSQASRSNILAGSLIPRAANPTAPPQPAPEPAPEPAAAPIPAATPVMASEAPVETFRPIETPRPRDEVELAEVVVTPAGYLKKRKPKTSPAPLVIGGAVALVVGVVGFSILTGKDAGRSPAAEQIVSQPAPAPVPVQPTLQPVVEPAVAAAAVSTPATPPPQLSESRSQPVPARPQRVAQAATPKVAAAPVEAAPAPIALNPTPIETPPPSAPVMLKPYTPPASPDPEAPMTNQKPGS